MHVEPIGLLSRVLYVPRLFVSLVSVQRIATLREYEISLMIVMLFYEIRSMGGGLDLIESGTAYIIYLT